MALPAGITTCTVTIGPYTTQTGEEGTVTDVSVVADRNIVWSATGSGVLKTEARVANSVLGGQASLALPHVNQAGFIDASGNAVTYWFAIVSWRASFDGNRFEQFTRKVQVLVGQDTIDIDLLEDGPASPGVTAPQAVVTSVNGQTGAVTVAGADNATVAGFVSSAGATKDALAASIVDQIEDTESPLRVLLDSLYGAPPGPDGPAYTLPAWSPALAAVMSGTSDACLALVGDSTSHGKGADGANGVGGPHSYPARVVVGLRDLGIPAAPGVALVWYPQSDAADARFTFGAGWSTSGGVGIGGAAGATWSDGTTTPTVFNPAGYGADPTLTYDRFDIYYLSNPGLGPFTVKATGGSTVTVSDANNPSGMKRVTVSAGLASATNTVTMTPVSGAGHILAIEARHSTERRVRVGNLGASGTFIDGWKAGSFGSQFHDGFLGLLDPDLTVISLGINDSFVSRTGSQYATALDALLTLVPNDALVAAPFPSTPAAASGARTLQAEYATACQTRGRGYLDFVSVVGGNPSDVALMSDNIHPNPAGYQVAADLVTDAIT